MAKCNKIRIVILLILITAIENTQAQIKLDTFFIKGANDVKISNYYTYFEDNTDTALLKTIVQQLQKNNFISKNKGNRVFNNKINYHPYWFVLAIKNDTTIRLNLLWNFYNNNLGFVLYDISNLNSPQNIDSVSSYAPLSKRPFASRAPAFLFNLDSGQYRLLLLKVNILNADGIYMPTDLSTTTDILLWENSYNFLMGKYIGYFMFIIVFNIFLQFILKAPIHGWHALFVFFLLLFILKEHMFDVFILPDWAYSLFAKFTKSIFLLLATVIGIIVFQRFIFQKKMYSKFYKVFNSYKVFALILLLLIVIATPFLENQNVFLKLLRMCTYVFLILGNVLIFSNIFYGLFKKDKLIFVYFIAVSFLLLSYIDYILNALFKIHPFFFEPGNILIGLSIEIIILTIAFFYKHQQNIKNGNIKLQEAQQLKLNIATQLVHTQELERKRIAQDLHDSLGASFSSLRFFVANYFKNFTVKDNDENEFRKNWSFRMVELSEEIRKIAHDIMPSDFEKSGLVNMLKNHISELNKSTQIKFEIIAPQTIEKLSIEKQLYMYRIATELIHNILKHSQASEATIQCILYEDVFEMQISDDGKGFDINQQYKGIGLSGVMRKVEFLHGNFSIDSNKYGTIIIITIPF